MITYETSLTITFADEIWLGLCAGYIFYHPCWRFPVVSLGSLL